MSKNEFIEYIYKNNLIQRWGNAQIKYIPPPLREDVIQEVYLLLAEYDEDKFDKIAKQGFNQLTAFIRQFVKNSLTPTGRTRNIVNLFSHEICDNELENNQNENNYEE